VYNAANGWLSIRVDDATGESAGATLVTVNAAMFVPSKGGRKCPIRKFPKVFL